VIDPESVFEMCESDSRKRGEVEFAYAVARITLATLSTISPI
jgi:hypothetical protein